MDKKILFGKNLRFLRKKWGFDQGKMGDVFSVKNTAWSNYEKGISFPDVSTLIEMSKYFGISETDLLHQDLESNREMSAAADPPSGIYNDALGKKIKELEKRISAIEENRSSEKRK